MSEQEIEIKASKDAGKITPTEVVAILLFLAVSAADYMYLLPFEWAHRFQMFALPAWMIISRLLRVARWGKVVDFVNQGRESLREEVKVSTAPRAEKPNCFED